MTKSLMLLICCCLPALSQCRDIGPSIAINLAAHGADAYSSYGRYEINPVLGRGTFGPRQVGIKLSGAAAVSAASWVLARRSPRACRWAARLNFIQAGAIGAVAARNWKVTR